jgi:hypothetical protein
VLLTPPPPRVTPLVTPRSHPHPQRYVLAYIETFRGVKRGDRVWQLGFGSGFKCNSAVWKANRAVRDRHAAWEGFDVEHMVRGGGAVWGETAGGGLCRGLPRAARTPVLNSLPLSVQPLPSTFLLTVRGACQERLSAARPPAARRCFRHAPCLAREQPAGGDAGAAAAAAPRPRTPLTRFDPPPVISNIRTPRVERPRAQPRPGRPAAPARARARAPAPPRARAGPAAATPQPRRRRRRGAPLARSSSAPRRRPLACGDSHSQPFVPSCPPGGAPPCAPPRPPRRPAPRMRGAGARRRGRGPLLYGRRRGPPSATPRGGRPPLVVWPRALPSAPPPSLAPQSAGVPRRRPGRAPRWGPVGLPLLGVRPACGPATAAPRGSQTIRNRPTSQTGAPRPPAARPYPRPRSSWAP